MIHLMRQMVDRPPSMFGRLNSQARSDSIDESSNDSVSASLYPLKPAQLIRDLQAECFGERDHFSSDDDILGDIVTQGIVDSKLSLKLIELYVSICLRRMFLLTLSQICGVFRPLGFDKPFVQHSAIKYTLIQHCVSPCCAVFAWLTTAYCPRYLSPRSTCRG
jgi:hypothetical protein